MDRKEKLRLRNNFRAFRRHIKDIKIFVGAYSIFGSSPAWHMQDFMHLLCRLTDKQDRGYHFN